MPAGGLDPSWLLATEHAVRSGAVFGRDYVFTYGPYAHLATRLFDPATYRLVIVYDVLTAVLLCVPALFNRSVGALAGLVAIMVVIRPDGDPVVMAAFLGVFLAALLRRGLITIVLVAACGPLALSKLSFLLVLAPLLMLADLRHLLRRRIPVFTPVFLACTLAALLIAGQTLSDAPAFAVNSLDIILGYGKALQFEGSDLETGLAVLLMGLLPGLAAVAAAPRLAGADEEGDPLTEVAALLGLCWFLFIAFKAGFVRQDAHTSNTFDALPLGLMVFWGYLGRVSAPASFGRRAAFIGAAGLLIAASFALKSHAVRPDVSQGAVQAVALRLDETVIGLPRRIEVAAGWLSGDRWRIMEARRTAALAGLRRAFPTAVQGSVDAIPFELAELIASGLEYRSRPVIQSYSSYTSRLQGLDAAHFSGPRAPDTLFFKLVDIDGRLPSLATGPSLPVLGRRYDVVGTDPLGLILRKRVAPRSMAEHALGEAPLRPNVWTSLPRTDGLLMAAIKLPPSLPGKAVSFLFREPVMTIHLRTTSGQIRSFRFVGGMAELGVALSPVPRVGNTTVLPLLDPAWRSRGEVATAMMIEAEDWAFRPGSVRFTGVQLEPGFGRDVGSAALCLSELAASAPKGQAALGGAEIFAHAPTTLSTGVPEATRVEGRFGLRPHPPGPPDDGVGFVVAAADPAGVETILFRETVLPGGTEGAFAVTVPADARLVLRTEQLGNSNFDWSYWKDLRFTKAP